MRLDHPLDDLFQGRSHVRVLRALHELPEGFGASGREVARRAGVSHPTALGVLASLVEQGVATVRRAAHADAYALNREHALVRLVAPLFEAERGMRDELLAILAERLAAVRLRIRAAYVFGSAARGEMLPDSDIDLAVVCAPADEDGVRTALEPVEEEVRRRFGNALNLIIGTRDPAVLGGGRGAGASLWRHVLAEGIPVHRPKRDRAARVPAARARA